MKGDETAGTQLSFKGRAGGEWSGRSWDPQGKGNRFNDLELEEKVGWTPRMLCPWHYQMADVSNSNLPLCLGRFYSLMVWIPSLLSSYLCQSFAAGCAVSKIVGTPTRQSGADTGVPLWCPDLQQHRRFSVSFPWHNLFANVTWVEPTQLRTKEGAK